MSVLANLVSVELVPEASEPGRGTAFLVLVVFLLTFLFIRTSARLIRDPNVTWWPGNVEAGGVHVHHMTFGITMILICGFLAFAADLSSPWWHLAAIGYGIGAGLTIDEFALWFYVKDVYWEQQGRLSVDAVILATTFALLVVIGTKPFGLDEPASVLGTAVLVAQALILSAVAFLKGHYLLGTIALFIPFWGLLAAFRLAKPGSPWARWFYKGKRAERLARSQERYRPDRRHARVADRLVSLTTGLSDPEDEPRGKP